MMHPHSCLDCGHAADLPQVCETGEMYGWLCRSCERKDRRRRMGWRRRTNLKLRRLLKL